MPSILDELKIFNPFRDITSDTLNLNDSDFEAIRTGCSFYDAKDMSLTQDNSSALNILHTNIRSIVNKVDRFELFLKLTGINWQIICISETWLTKEIEHFYNIKGYKGFFTSRTSKRAGGSAIYVREDLHAEQLEHPPFATADVTCIQIKLEKKRGIIISQIYRAPNVSDVLFTEELERLLIWIYKKNTTSFITGDFNYDLFDIASDSYVNAFFTLMCSFGFLPAISKTTRCSNTICTLIDNIFCNNMSKINSSGIILDDLSDHFPVFIAISLEQRCIGQSSRTISIFDYTKINEMQSFLRDELLGLQDINDPEEIASSIINAYQKGIVKFSYTKRLNRQTDARKPWVTPGVLASINQKNKLFRRKLSHPSEENTKRYLQHRNMLNSVIRTAKKNYFKKEIQNNLGDSKATWKTIFKLIGKRKDAEDSYDSLIDEHGKTVETDALKAECFNTYFAEVGSKLQEKIRKVDLDPLELITAVENEMSLPPTSYDELSKIITELNNVAAGHDSINAKIFKSTYKHIFDHILHLYNACLSAGIFPDILKIAMIKPIYKSGDKKQPNNYRPISILPFMSKILEQLINSRLVKHITDNALIHENQFGFQKNRSTYMPLLILQEIITKSFENGEHVLGIFLDLRKAFDTVDIDILLCKLKRLGIRNKSFQIIQSFLKNRKQCVKIGHSISSYRQVTMGVPQGSILGPVLFLIYVNDLPQISPHITCLLYADDTAILIKHKSPTKLQKIVDDVMPKISDWFSANLLSINAAKTFTQHYSNIYPQLRLRVSINGEDITENKEIRYLGVLLDKQLKFTAHINSISRIISRNIGIISRVRHFIDSNIAYLLYNSMILPYLNYCCLIWGINYHSQLQRVTILQKKAVRLIEGVYPPTSSKPLFKKYRIMRISDIAHTQMILVMHKFLTAQLPSSFNEIYCLNTAHLHETRQVKHLTEPKTNRNYRLFTTTLAGPRLWNTVCAPFFSRNEITSSKRIIKRICLDHFLAQHTVE